MSKKVVEINLFPEGFAPIRNGLREHIKAGKLHPTDLGVYLYLQLECNWATGIYHGTALGIAFGFDDSGLKKQVQTSLQRLRKARFINYREGNGTRGGYDILIHKFRPRSGKLFGMQLDAWEHGDKSVPEYVPAAVERLRSGASPAEERLMAGGGPAHPRPIPEDLEDLEFPEVPELPEEPGRESRSFPSGEQEQPEVSLPKSTVFQIDEDEDAIKPAPEIPSVQQPAQRVGIPARAAPPAKIVNKAQGHRFAQTHNGQKCVACNIHFSTYQSARRPCPNEEMDIEAAEVPQPVKAVTPAPVNTSDFTNPVRSHDWSKDKNVCSRCKTTLDEAKYEGVVCA